VHALRRAAVDQVQPVALDGHAMKAGHLVPRGMRTRGEKSITWARVAPPANVSDGITYRLARRDLSGTAHMEVRTFFRQQTRGEIARSLLEARLRLRDVVDSRDLVFLGLVEASEPA